jgi:hypothetical protein
MLKEQQQHDDEEDNPFNLAPELLQSTNQL